MCSMLGKNCTFWYCRGDWVIKDGTNFINVVTQRKLFLQDAMAKVSLKI